MTISFLSSSSEADIKMNLDERFGWSSTMAFKPYSVAFMQIISLIFKMGIDQARSWSLLMTNVIFDEGLISENQSLNMPIV